MSSFLASWSTCATRLSGEDKLEHMRWSFGLTMLASLIWPLYWAVVAVFMLGIAKECWDHRFGSGFCLWDILSNVIGMIPACIFAESLLRGSLDS